MTSRAALLAWLRRSRAAPDAEDRRQEGRAARHTGVARVLRELRAVGVRERFRFVWAIDGSGVEEDAPRVIHLHRPLARHDPPREVLAAAERVMSLDVASVARHELGHALLFLRPTAARAAAFRRLFGDVRAPYRVASPLGEVERRLVRHRGLGNPRYARVISLYAATHPLEAFAEAVRIALAHAADDRALAAWAERHRTAERVLDQLRLAARFLRDW